MNGALCTSDDQLAERLHFNQKGTPAFASASGHILSEASPALSAAAAHCHVSAREAVGAVPSPFDCYLLWRGLKTLHVRMQRHMHNAFLVASALLQHPLVRAVHFPGASALLCSMLQFVVTRKQLATSKRMYSSCCTRSQGSSRTRSTRCANSRCAASPGCCRSFSRNRCRHI